MRVFHVIGYTQYYGTCKMHLFNDCSQLMKKRISHRNWGDSDSTGHITGTDYNNVLPQQICKLCQQRKAKRVAAQGGAA